MEVVGHADSNPLSPRGNGNGVRSGNVRLGETTFAKIECGRQQRRIDAINRGVKMLGLDSEILRSVLGHNSLGMHPLSRLGK